MTAPAVSPSAMTKSPISTTTSGGHLIRTLCASPCAAARPNSRRGYSTGLSVSIARGRLGARRGGAGGPQTIRRQGELVHLDSQRGESHGGNHRRRRQRVLHQRAAQELAGRVVDEVLEQRAADPLGDGAVDLSL